MNTRNRHHFPNEGAWRVGLARQILLVSLVLLTTQWLRAAGLIFDVDSAGDGSDIAQGDGFCATGTGDCTLRAAIQEANAHAGDDAIEFAIANSFSGTFGSQTINLSGPLPPLSTNIEIVGPGPGKLTIRASTGGSYQIFSVTTMGAVVISGLTISNGNSGITDGGAIANTGGATVTITNCTFTDNSAGFGGAIANNATGTINVYKCMLIGNTAVRWGGAFKVTNGAVNVVNCTISGNSATSPGGGIGGLGGAFYIGGGNVTISNCTIAENSAAINGGGVFNSNGTVQIKSSLVALNTATVAEPDLRGSFMSQGFNLIGRNDGAVASFPMGNPNANNDIVGTSAMPVDPKLDPNGLQNNGGPALTIALQSNSPAIDKGTSVGITGTSTVDQRGVGFLRKIDNPSVTNAVRGDGADVGAFEFGAHIDVASRKIHGSAPRDIVLPVSGLSGIECRSGGASGDHQVLMTFPAAVTVGGVSVMSSDRMASATKSVNNQIVTIDLHDVANAQTLMISLANLSDGTNTNDLSFPMSVLLGDTTGNGTVSSSDVSQTKSRSGQPVDASNFRSDVGVSNSINSSDVSVVKSESGTALP